MYNPTPKEVEDNLNKARFTGDIVRITHMRRNNGDPCSEGKDQALVLTKTQTGHYWFCHRCKEWGELDDKRRSPKELLESIHRRKAWEKKVSVSDGVKIPKDCVPVPSRVDGLVPERVYNWLEDNHFSLELAERNHFFWSPGFNRLIMPVYRDDRLEGWVGRNVYFEKGETEQKYSGRYLVQKCTDVDRLIYNRPKFSHDFSKDFSEIVVYVEDILSAIKVNRATGLETNGILNSSLPNDEIMKNRKRTNIFWLDFDQGQNMVNSVSKYSSRGVTSMALWSAKDPKRYDAEEIKRLIEQRMYMYKRR